MPQFRRFSPVLIVLLVLGSVPLTAQSADQLYAGGRQAFTDELWPTAVSQFSRLLREFPDDPRADSAAYMGAVARYNAGEYRQSAEELAAFPRRYPDSAWNRRVAYWEGLARYALEDWGRAASAFARQAELRSEAAYRERSLVYLGACRESLRQWRAAETAYETVLDEGRDYELKARSVFRLGQIRLADQRPAEALEAFNILAYDYFSSPQAVDSEYWIAECQRRLGRDEAALDGYRNFLQTVYESEYRGYALLEAARLAAASGLDDEALAYLDLRDEERPPGFDEGAAAALRIRAASYLRLGMLSEARSAYRRVLASPVDRAEEQSAAFDLAQTWIGTPEVIQAVPYLEQAAAGPDSRLAADALYLAGTVMLHEGRPRGAGHLETFAARFPGDSRREEALRLAVKSRRESGSDAEARRGLDTLIRDYPDSDEAPAYLFLRGEIALEGGDETAALRDYGELVRRYPDAATAVEAHSRIGFIYASRAEHARAAGHFQDAAELAGGLQGGEPGRRALYSAGIAWLNAGESDRAVDLLSRIVGADPSGPWGAEAAFYLGEAYYDVERYAEARRAYESAVRYGRDEWAFEAAYGIGWTWFREAEWNRAADAFEIAAARAADDENRARARYRVGLSRASAEDWEAALVEYRRALESGRGAWREEALYQNAWALLQLERIDDSDAVAAQLLQEFPESRLPADLPFRMGEQALASGDALGAVDWFDRCVSAYPETATASTAALRAAFAAREAGRPADAADRYGAWVERHPADPGVGAAARSWAEALMESGDPDRAAGALERIRTIEELGADVRAPLIIAWARLQGIPPESRSLLEEIAENAALPAADRSEALLMVAHRHRLDGRSGRSRQIYEVLVRDVPGRIGAEAQVGLARSYVDEDRIDEAAEAFLAVPYLFPDQVDLGNQALRQAERLYRQAGRIDEADKVRSRLDQ